MTVDDKIVEALAAIISDWDERAVGDQEKFIEPRDDMPGYWSPNARMVSSEKIAAGRDALKALESRKAGLADAHSKSPSRPAMPKEEDTHG